MTPTQFDQRFDNGASTVLASAWPHLSAIAGRLADGTRDDSERIIRDAWRRWSDTGCSTPTGLLGRSATAGHRIAVEVIATAHRPPEHVVPARRGRPIEAGTGPGTASERAQAAELVVLILLMTATTFTTQRQLMRKNMPPEALTGQYAQQQKILLYVLPIVFAVGGVNFPIGVLIYWFTTNVWTMGQQFWVIRRNPAPGTAAYEAWEKRKAQKAARKAARKGEPAEATAVNGTQSKPATKAPTVKRVQPQRLPRSKRKGR